MFLWIAALASCATQSHPVEHYRDPGVGYAWSRRFAADPSGAEPEPLGPRPPDRTMARALSPEESAAIGLSYDDTIFTASARTVDFNGQALMPRFSYVEATDTYDGDDSVADPADRELRAWTASLQAVFGLDEDLTIGVRVPYVAKELETTLPGGERVELDARGLGDVSTTAKWRFFKRPGPGETTEAAAFLGLELPTGDDDQEDEGMELPMPLQPGSGSTDLIGGLAFTRLWDGGRWLVNADVFYKANTEGNDYEFGDVLRFDVGGQYRLYPQRYEHYEQTTVNLVLELNTRYRFRDRLRGERLSDTGGFAAFLSPGLQIIASDSLLIEAGVQLPVYRDLNGPQLGEDLAFTIGLRWRF